MYRIAPSILSADFARLGEEVKSVIAAGAELHPLRRDGNDYVPNLTIGPLVAKALKPYCVRPEGAAVPLDVHLTVQLVDELASAFVAAGADLVCFTRSIRSHRSDLCSSSAAADARRGLPSDPADLARGARLDVIDKVDLVLIMSVNPGFGGQSFIDSALRKVQSARKLIDATGRDIRLEVDGGIKAESIRRVAEQGPIRLSPAAPSLASRITKA